jgi:hypothetical protein
MRDTRHHNTCNIERVYYARRSNCDKGKLLKVLETFFKKLSLFEKRTAVFKTKGGTFP